MVKKNLFGIPIDQHEIQYDSIINHDTYTFLRVSLEVPRNQKEETLVLLNGKEVGKVRVIEENGKIKGYEALRVHLPTKTYVDARSPVELYRKLGKAITAIILADYIE